MIFTGDWEILKGERIRRWPSQIGEVRPIKIDINSWVGISIGAKHVMLKIEEEDNAYWCEDKNCWVHIYSDTTARGISMEANVYTDKQAEELAIFFLKNVVKVTPETHKLRGNNKVIRAVFGPDSKDLTQYDDGED